MSDSEPETYSNEQLALWLLQVGNEVQKVRVTQVTILENLLKLAQLQDASDRNLDTLATEVERLAVETQRAVDELASPRRGVRKMPRSPT